MFKEERLLFSDKSTEGNAEASIVDKEKVSRQVAAKGHKQHKLNAKTKASVRCLMRKLEQQGYRCALSGVPLTPETATLDHIHPVSLGGTDEPENLQWIDKNVNRAKSTMSQEDFIDMCRRVAAYTR